MENDKWLYYILISAGIKFRNKNKFRYDIPAHFERWLLLMHNAAEGNVQ
jgi:hypothetical protein